MSSLGRAWLPPAWELREPSCTNIMQNELLSDIKKGKSTAVGLHGVTYDIINSLANREWLYLDLSNISNRVTKLPGDWKQISLLKKKNWL